MKTFTTDIPQPVTCPDCLGPGCVHCRERHAEISSRPHRSWLTDQDRLTLALFVRRPRTVRAVRTTPWTGSHRMIPVLPANFSL